MKTLKLLFLLWLGIFFCWSCSSEEDVIPEQIVKIELSSTQLPVLQEGGTYDMTFTASADWKAEVDETRSVSWLSIVPMSGGAGTVTLSVTTTSNETYDERNATVTLTSGAVSKSFVVSQKQKDALMVTSNKVEVSSVGGGIEIEVKANISFESEVEQSAQEWITPIVTRGLTTSTLLFNVKENENREKREGKILIRSGESVETVTVYQEGSKPTIVLTQDTYIVSSNGESIKVELSSNVDYEVQLPGVDWLTETVTRAFSTHTYYFTISPNDTYDARTANIVFSNKAENLSDTVTVTQMQKDAIIIAQNEYTVDASGGNLEFDVNTNLEFTVEIVDSWIKQQTESRGLVTKSLYFVVEANTGNEKREGTINIVSGDLKQTIKVVQNSVVERERVALIEFYKATNGDRWTRNDNWCSDRPLDEWYGVTISPTTKQVTSLDLNSNNLTGTIPGNIGDLIGLRYLYLRDNNIGGELPATLVNLQQLAYISFAGNKLSGDMPVSVTNLPTWGENCLYEIIQNGTYFNFSTTNLKLPAFNKTDIMTSVPINNVDILKEKELTIVYIWGRNNTYDKENLSALYERFKDCGLNILAVNRDEIEESVLKSYIQDNNMDSWYHITTSGINWGYYYPSILVFDSNSECLYYSMYESVIGKNLETIVKERLGDGKPMYESTDYSKDGKYKLLQKATQGRGIDLIFMGEAFADIDIASGHYEQTMQDAVEQFFSIEPYKSFRDRFNAYMVNVISQNNEFREGAVHRINGDNAVCFEYAQKVPGINTDRLHVSVIYNTKAYIGRSITWMYSDGSFVGYMMHGVDNVLNHESGGHGFAKLKDEYVEGGFENLSLPEDDKRAMDSQWKDWGWGANVDWRNDRETVKWSRFLNDSRYANEGLGLYEGSYLYGYGAYRPTENSMMRYNDSPFNAPSREQIYKCIMQQSEGTGWTYDYEKFVEYDAVNRNATTSRALQTQPSETVRKDWQKRHRPPVYVNGTWRDAVKKQQTTVVPLR